MSCSVQMFSCRVQRWRGTYHVAGVAPVHEPAGEVPRLHQLHERREHGRHRLSCSDRRRKEEPRRQQRRPPRTQLHKPWQGRTSWQQRGEQQRVGRQRVEPRPGRPPPLAVASRLLLDARLQLYTWGWQWPAAGARTRRMGWQERARPEQQRARHRRHHPCCHSTYWRVDSGEEGKGDVGSVAWRQLGQVK